MGLFDDDFYSSKVSRRSRFSGNRKQHAETWNWKRASRSHRHTSLSTLQVAIVSSITSAAFVILMYSWLIHAQAPTTVVAAAEPSIDTIANAYDDLLVQAADKASPTIVSILNKQKAIEEEESKQGLDDISLGSGIIFEKKDNDAYILTNEHVVSGAEQLEIVLSNGQRKHAEVVGKDKISDLAVLKIDGAGVNQIAEFGDSRSLRRGETVIAIGNPFGLGGSLTSGIISYTNRMIPISLNGDGVYDWEQTVIQTDAAINEGNSGGALIDLHGRVIGINTMKIASTGAEGLGFAIPMHEVGKVVDQLMKKGKVIRPYLGVYTVDLENEYAPITDEQRSDLKLPKSVTSGVIVLEASGPAQEAGFKLNDVIVKFDKQDISTTLELRRYLYEHKQVGDTMEITYYRDGKQMKITVTLGDRPNS
ncbi:S1C family serine protease [Paenibacillus arenosi]|uniref:Trypsin-like peptidase domain-containing protein n=1 Tax=Paenibacillus arenosi TaxID=2774142 RepID=A0ABR9AV31_9BACL|nr:trypsin-like peptidase domain-containing protein [Paenibacillus arenosi]MBD8497877.1 trypsin-like peptidase domain-containing protein [Paenibacillus arenosi]